MDALRRQRSATRSKLTRLETFVNTKLNADAITQDSLEVRIETINSTWNEFQQLQRQIIQGSEESESFEEDILYESTCEEKYYTVKEKLKRALRSLTQQPEAIQPHMESALDTSNQIKLEPESIVRLPRLSIPTFSGDYADWLSFYDLFKSTVHENTSLSDAQRLQYLKSSLKGEAENILKHVTITNANYLESWAKLVKRYDKKKHIVTSFIKRFMEQQQTVQSNLFSLRNIANTSDEVIRGMKALGPEWDTRDPWLIYIILGKLDNETRLLWSQELMDNDTPTFSDLLNFLEQRCDALEISQDTTKKVSTNTSFTKLTPKPLKNLHADTNSAISCSICAGDHLLYHCQQFKDKSIEDRRQFVRENKLCFNCLHPYHMVNKCTSKSTCRNCKGRHHTLLHMNNNTNVETNSTLQSSPDSTAVTSHHSMGTELYSAILPTAMVRIRDSSGQYQLCRVLLDSGSQSSFITEACVQRLKLQRKQARIPVNGLANSKAGVTRGLVNIVLQSQYDSSNCYNMNAFILSQLTSPIPAQQFDKSGWKHLQGIQLADPKFNQPNQIDILIGAHYVMHLLIAGQITNKDEPIAQNTALGWIVTGQQGLQEDDSIQNVGLITLHAEFNIDDSLQKFWELEEVSNDRHLTQEEKQCEDHFNSSYKRDNDGRFVVKLPFSQNNNLQLGDSLNSAVHRLKMMERKFSRNESFKQAYVSFMKEYLQLGHMELIPNAEVNIANQERYYLPHHAVIKDTSSTTRLRVVFDASCKSSTGVSLNDLMMTGPTIQDELMSILLRFRTHEIAYIADVEKMFRQIKVHSSCTNFQRIVWRDDPTKVIEHYRLLTVTYGTSPAPFLATRSLHQVGMDMSVKYPSIYKKISQDFYMDDLMSGSFTIKEACLQQQQITEVLQSGGFCLRKWMSNSPELLNSIPIDSQEVGSFHIKSDNNTIKTLGLHWQPQQDTFQFKVASIAATVSTKRQLLSESSKLFDPLGWLSPCIIQIKILFQSLWLANLSWDDPLPIHITQQWFNIRESWDILEEIHIPRWLPNHNKQMQLHGFSDASENAYSAVVYCRSISQDGIIQVNIVAAKTKVAPLKQLSIPKLELAAAVLLTRLIKKISQSFRELQLDIFAWTDSTIVLSWLNSHPRRWKTFVANRVSEILDFVPRRRWHHVNSEFNPADCASRGISALALMHHKLWWKGPPWLTLPASDWPGSTNDFNQDAILEEKTSQLLIHACVDSIEAHDELNIFYKFSSLSKLIRVISYCHRFIRNSKLTAKSRRTGYLTTAELKEATNLLIRLVQDNAFKEELRLCRRQQPVSTYSKLRSLNPFLDSDGLLRVGGRLQHAFLSHNAKHPVILPKDHIFTEMLINTTHLKYLHCGPTLLSTIIGQNYWIISGRSVIRKLIHKCVICVRYGASTINQLMSNLPASRVTASHPFTHTGVDYAGPFNLLLSKGRGRRSHKGYISVFVCFCTKAVHLELVTELTTNAFIAALKRFIGRRGKPADIYSDNGTNFVGAKKYLNDIQTLVSSDQHNNKVSHFLTNESVNWHMIPPSAPHFGGLWEAAVKSVKNHLRRVLNDRLLTYEEMNTVLVEIEACLNSRPLCPKTDSDELHVITPAHFLIGRALSSISEPDVSHLKLNHLDRWQLIQRITSDFWKRWHKEYVTSLQQRIKWNKEMPNLKINDLVIIREDNLPPSKWALGRITQLHPGLDGLVRAVTLRNQHGYFQRPVTKLCLLPVC